MKLRAGEWSFNALFKSGTRELDAKIEALFASVASTGAIMQLREDSRAAQPPILLQMYL
jgi:hypothetical protein